METMLTIKELAKRVGVSDKRIYQLIDEGRGPQPLFDRGREHLPRYLVPERVGLAWWALHRQLAGTA